MSSSSMSSLLVHLCVSFLYQISSDQQFLPVGLKAVSISHNVRSYRSATRGQRERLAWEEVEAGRLERDGSPWNRKLESIWACLNKREEKRPKLFFPSTASKCERATTHNQCQKENIKKCVSNYFQRDDSVCRLFLGRPEWILQRKPSPSVPEATKRLKGLIIRSSKESQLFQPFFKILPCCLFLSVL